MLNQTVLVGRLVRDPEIKKLEDGKEVSNITLAVQRSYKNAEGVHDCDFIDCTLWNGVAASTAEYCKQGDIVGVKGRVQTDRYEVDGETKYKTGIVAEKITFLSSRKEKEDTVEKDTDEDIEM